MLTKDLFEKVLIEPVHKGANKLYIVSGYATSAMAFHHLDNLRNQNKYIDIELYIGMCAQDGLSLSNHCGFKKLVEDDFSGNFHCSYIIEPPAVHSKIFAWYKDKEPFCGFAGSANYTQTAFLNRQREVLTDCNPIEAYEYFQALSSDTIYCTHPDSENFVQIYNDRYYLRKKRIKEILPEVEEREDLENTTGLESVVVSLLDRSGNMHYKAGLNWGQREGRDPNQAYIQLKPEIYRSNFFPLRSIHFTVQTDDGKTLICTRAQKNEFGAAIETPQNNSQLGEYFRNRLGLAYGEFVTKQNLVNYGRTDVTFYKIDEENFYMDFSV